MTLFREKIIQKWQKCLWNVKKSWKHSRRNSEVEEEGEDEHLPISVAEIPSSEAAGANILNRVDLSSSSRGLKNDTLRYYCCMSAHRSVLVNPTSDPAAASPVNFPPESRSLDSSVIQALPRPVFLKVHSHPRDTLHITYQYQ